MVDSEEVCAFTELMSTARNTVTSGSQSPLKNVHRPGRPVRTRRFQGLSYRGRVDPKAPKGETPGERRQRERVTCAPQSG
jgi:hypothetical protein